jgi:hypothetical protein
MADTVQEFYYLITDLHDLANLESLYALNSVEEKDGQSLPDKMILGMDELVFFKRLLKTAGAEVYKRIHRRGRGITSPYKFNEEYDSVAGYIIYKLGFPENFDTNLFDSIDSQIKECLIFHVLAGWFSKQRNNFLAEEYKTYYNTNIDQLKSLIEMRTSVRRPSVFIDRYYTEEEEEDE